jgi:hypothetical protein
VRRFIGFVVASLLVGSAVAGCGGGDSDGGSKGGGDASTATTAAKAASSGGGVGFTCPDVADVTAAFGHDVAVEGQQSNKYCKFAFKDDATGNSITAIYTWASFDSTEDPGVADPESVSGVGDKAVWDAGGNSLAVWTGTGSVLVNYLAIGFPDLKQKQKETAIELAKLVL